MVRFPCILRLYRTSGIRYLNGTYKYNERLPNEKWLCNLYDISRTTLRKSIDELIAEGLLERHSNKGVYVVYSKFDTGFDRPYSLFQEMVKSGIKPSSKILSFSRINADSKLSRALNCEVNTPLLEILRLRYADDVPFNIQQLYLIEFLFSSIQSVAADGPFPVRNHGIRLPDKN